MFDKNNISSSVSDTSVNYISDWFVTSFINVKTIYMEGVIRGMIQNYPEFVNNFKSGQVISMKFDTLLSQHITNRSI